MRRPDKRWLYSLRGSFYAFGPVEAPSKAAVKAEIRRSLGVDRLPAGTGIWEAPKMWRRLPDGYVM